MAFRTWRAFVIVAVGLGLGLVANAVRSHSLPYTANAQLKAGDEEITVAALKERIDKGALVLDARGKMFYDMAHIPGAENLAEDQFDKDFARLEPKLRESLDVVVYCAGYGCEASHIVARKLKERNVQAVVLADGWPAWEDAGYPQAKGPNP